MSVEVAGNDHLITAGEAITLDGLFAERVRRTPDLIAYRAYTGKHDNWRDYSWGHINHQVGRWQAAMEKQGVQPGDRVAVMLRNSPEWVIFDQAAMGLGLVVVPLYTQDRADNVAYILNNSDCRILLIEGREHWELLREALREVPGLRRVVTLEAVNASAGDDRLTAAAQWLPAEGGETRHLSRDGTALATIVYTSGTTGRPKGVMLSHQNILSNVEACLRVFATGPADTFLSFLPLSHTFERTCGYYLTVMSGSTVAYARSVTQLGEDLMTIRPTMLISVPRIYERIWGNIRAKLDEGPAFRRKLFLYAAEVGYARFEYRQGREPWRLAFLLWPLLERLVARKLMERLGGRMRLAISGGAALSPSVSRIFIGLGLNILQGYGLTETSPVATANPPTNNVPASVGLPIPGVEVKIGERGAVLIRGPNIMMGYWQNEEATRAMIQDDGWLNSGDTGRIGELGHVFITGRVKEIIVLSNGEKLPPNDMEAAITRDPLFEQVMILGEGKPYLSVMTVLNAEHWHKLAAELGLDPASDADLRSEAVEQAVLARIGAQMSSFPGYAQVRLVSVMLEPWTVENGLLTPTLKLKRSKVMEKFNAEIDRMYSGH
jgi:long-chain acyl-CoA synthetase